jgi:hypothetical protein
LVRLGTVAAIVGVVAGLWNIWAYYQPCHVSEPFALCVETAPSGMDGTVILGLAVVLIIGSLATFLAPAVLFYVLAAIGLMIDAVEVLNYSAIGSGPFYITLILMTLSAALSVLAAVRKTTVSEQSHPMNLPVFG